MPLPTRTPTRSTSGPQTMFTIPSWVQEDVELLEFLLDEYQLTRAQVRSALKAKRQAEQAAKDPK